MTPTPSNPAGVTVGSTWRDYILFRRGELCVICDRCNGCGFIVVTCDGDELPATNEEIVSTVPEEWLPCPECVAGASAFNDLSGFSPVPQPETPNG